MPYTSPYLPIPPHISPASPLYLAGQEAGQLVPYTSINLPMSPDISLNLPCISQDKKLVNWCPKLGTVLAQP